VHVARGRLSLALGNDPVLDADPLIREPIGAARDVARREDPGDTALEYSFTATPRSVASPACSANAMAGRTPMPITTISASSVSPFLNVTLRSPIEVAVRVSEQHGALANRRRRHP
jgi:hypothetical protein